LSVSGEDELLKFALEEPLFGPENLTEITSDGQANGRIHFAAI